VQHAIRVTIGIGLIALAFLATIYSVRVARSQRIYHTVKYGDLSEAAPAAVHEALDAAFSLYPHNYHLCIEATARLWPAGGLSSGERSAALAQVEQWCDRGLAENPHPWELRRMKTRLLAETSPDAAADYWREYVEWQFWVPHNLRILVECYARAGRLVEAAEILPLLEGYAGQHARASAALRRGWAAEMRRDAP